MVNWNPLCLKISGRKPKASILIPSSHTAWTKRQHVLEKSDVVVGLKLELLMGLEQTLKGRCKRNRHYFTWPLHDLDGAFVRIGGMTSLRNDRGSNVVQATSAKCFANHGAQDNWKGAVEAPAGTDGIMDRGVHSGGDRKKILEIPCYKCFKSPSQPWFTGVSDQRKDNACLYGRFSTLVNIC